MKTLFKILLFISSVIILMTSFFLLSTEIFSNNKPEPLPEYVHVESFSPFQKVNGEITVQEDFLEENQVIFDSIYTDVKISSTPINNSSFYVNSTNGKISKKEFNGRRINIAVTGLDSRIGERVGNADANHVISLILDKGEVEIFSVPRDTYSDCGAPDTSDYNKISLKRSKFGRRQYLNSLAEIVKIDKIHYHIEIGFSQAIGILDILGFEDSRSTLQLLRSRKQFRGGDWQRVYNQGKMIKDLLTMTFKGGNNVFGKMILNSVLPIIDTDISYNKAIELINIMSENGFEGSQKSISVNVRPDPKFEFKELEFFNMVKAKKEDQNSNDELDSLINMKLLIAISNAEFYSDKPYKVIQELKAIYDQRSWLQIRDLSTKIYLREKISELLIKAHQKRSNFEIVNRIKSELASERSVFDSEMKMANLSNNINAPIKVDFK